MILGDEHPVDSIVSVAAGRDDETRSYLPPLECEAGIRVEAKAFSRVLHAAPGGSSP
jgi:hypothetical protein